MDLPEQEKLYLPEPQLITLIVPSSECQDPNWSKNTSEKEQEWSDNFSSWLVNIHPASSSSIKSIPSEDHEWKVKEEIHKYKGLCFSCSISQMALNRLKQSKLLWLQTESISWTLLCYDRVESTEKLNSQIHLQTQEFKSLKSIQEK